MAKFKEEYLICTEDCNECKERCRAWQNGYNASSWNDYIGELQDKINKVSTENYNLKRKVNELQQWSLNDGKVRYGYKTGVNLQLIEENKKLYKLLERFGEQPSTVTEEINELNEENNRLVEENEKLKNKLWEIEHIARGDVK